MKSFFRLLGLLLFIAHAAVAAKAAQSVTLAWNANSETNLAGYRLYWGLGSRQYHGFLEVLAPTTQGTVRGLDDGTTYYFAVTAFTVEGLESDYSEEIIYTTSGTPPNPDDPLPAPEGLVISKEKGLVSWPILAAYQDALEQSPDLSTWTEVCSVCPQRSGRYVFAPDFSQPAMFYRLRRERRP